MKERKILIIEDDPDHADLILDIFEIENFKNKVICFGSICRAKPKLTKLSSALV